MDVPANGKEWEFKLNLLAFANMNKFPSQNTHVFLIFFI
jgi:hypothetical protein